MNHRRRVDQTGTGLFSLKIMNHSRPLVLAVGVILLLGSSFAFATPSFAVQAAPRSSASIYVTTSSTGTAYSQGCTQGTSDATSPIQSSEVILDFGGQNSAGTGSITTFTSLILTYSQIAAYSDAFAQGYYACTGAVTSVILTLGVGTNDSAYQINGAGGTAWANSAVLATKNLISTHGYSSQVTTVGASDMEPYFASDPTNTTLWLNGFSSTNVGRIINFGSADGCPQTTYTNGACNGTWKQYDVWYLSWGNLWAMALPEIYYGTQSKQWTMISRYGYYSQSGRIVFDGPMTEYGANGTYSSLAAWNQFWADINSGSSTASNFTYATDIKHY